jgi:hypothetical protein
MQLTTISGKKVDFYRPVMSMISLEDIAHALSHICRFNGHVHKFYSVAEHSVLLSKLVPEEYALSALFHDAAEAYIGDTRPMRSQITGLEEVEARFNSLIVDKFGLKILLDCDEIAHADKRMLVTERPELDIPGVEPFHIHLNHWSPSDARAAFMMRYFELR